MQVLTTGSAPATPQVAHILKDTSALAATSNMIAAIYSHPPASGVEYFAQELRNFNPIQPAYAQVGGAGIGYNALSPVQGLWSAIRNISYIGFVIVFVVIGFMIMLRARISPQAVATIQDSIPRIIIALILVTFSYAIVGLIIDVMFLFLNFMISALQQAGLIDTAKANSIIFDQSILGTIMGAWGEIVNNTSDAVSSLIEQVVTFNNILEKLLGSTLGGIAGVIVGIAALFITVKILFMLLMAYVSIIIFTVFAPFLLLFQALPGNNGARDWFKQLIANIAVFPVVALMVLFAGILGNITSWTGVNRQVIGSGDVGQFPLLSGGINVAVIGYLIGLGFLFMVPSAANMIKERLKSGAGPAFGGPGAAALGAAAGWMGRRATASAPWQGVTGAVAHGRGERAVRIGEAVPGWMRGGARAGSPAGTIRERSIRR